MQDNNNISNINEIKQTNSDFLNNRIMNQNLISKQNNEDLYKNKIEIKKYDLLKTNNNFYSRSLEEFNYQKNFETLNGIEKESSRYKMYKIDINKKDINNQNIQQEKDTNKYVVYNDDYIGNDDNSSMNSSMNFSHLFDNYLNQTALQLLVSLLNITIQ